MLRSSVHCARAILGRALRLMLRLVEWEASAGATAPSPTPQPAKAEAGSVAPSGALRRTWRPPPIPRDLASEADARLGEAAPESSIPGPTVRGQIDDLALATLLELLELERRSCLVSLVSGFRVLEFDVRRGAIVRARIDGDPSEVLTALGVAFAWRRAEFTLTPKIVSSESDAPHSVNELLLQMFQRHDEAARAG